MSERHPLGIPISRAILLPPGPLGDVLQPALEAIDRVHGDGILTQITVELDPTIADESIYERVEPQGIAYRIAIRPAAHQPRLKLVHEIGHFLDHHAMGTPGEFWSLNDPLLTSWRESISASRLLPELRDSLRRSVEPNTQRYLTYLLSYDELWVRSYEQYVATASRDTDLMRQLREARRPPFWPSRIPQLWNAEEFEPVGRAIEDILRSFRWIR